MNDFEKKMSRYTAGSWSSSISPCHQFCTLVLHSHLLSQISSSWVLKMILEHRRWEGCGLWWARGQWGAEWAHILRVDLKITDMNDLVEVEWGIAGWCALWMHAASTSTGHSINVVIIPSQVVRLWRASGNGNTATLLDLIARGVANTQISWCMAAAGGIVKHALCQFTHFLFTTFTISLSTFWNLHPITPRHCSSGCCQFFFTRVWDEEPPGDALTLFGTSIHRCSLGWSMAGDATQRPPVTAPSPSTPPSQGGVVGGARGGGGHGVSHAYVDTFHTSRAWVRPHEPVVDAAHVVIVHAWEQADRLIRHEVYHAYRTPKQQQTTTTNNNNKNLKCMYAFMTS